MFSRLKRECISNTYYILHRVERYECVPTRVIVRELMEQTFNDILGITLCFLVDRCFTTLCQNWSAKEMGRKRWELKKIMKQDEIFVANIFLPGKLNSLFSDIFIWRKDEEKNLSEKVYSIVPISVRELHFFLWRNIKINVSRALLVIIIFIY